MININILHRGKPGVPPWLYYDVSFPQSQIAISMLSLYSERFTESIGIIDSMRSYCNKEDIVISQIVITRVDYIFSKATQNKFNKAIYIITIALVDI